MNLFPDPMREGSGSNLISFFSITLVVLAPSAVAADPSIAERSPCALIAGADAQAEGNGPLVPALHPVRVRIGTALSSKTAQIGQCFPISLAEPLMIDGRELVPAGATGLGEVVHAAKARAAGKGGELILAARFVDHDGSRIMLRSFEFSKAGQNQLDAAVMASAALPFAGYLFSGGNVSVAEGATASAKVRYAVRISRSDSEPGTEGSGQQGMKRE